MAKPIIRPAEDADMSTLRRRVGAYFELFGFWPDIPEAPDFLDAQRAFGNLLVGEVKGRVVGFGGTLRRGTLTHLDDLFVVPEHQSSGMGRMILAQLLPQGSPKITCATDDECALGLYVRNGMRPRCPLLHLEGTGRSAWTATCRTPIWGSTRGLAPTEGTAIRRSHGEVRTDRSGPVQEQPQSLSPNRM
ncbi:GNAT family N-acetyltransferase [Microbispora sp. NPDC088329]|uniref:GNAT family N-acetyltransferase n=1 Tax=Microbispora sp. NPDC088329 TaxID=3154869 RepID=UPI00341D25F8